MIRFPSISIAAPHLPTPGEHPKAHWRPADRMTLGAELREAATTDNSGFLAALNKRLNEPGAAFVQG